MTLIPRTLPRMSGWLMLSLLLASVIYLTMPIDANPSRWGRFLSFVKQLNNATIAGWLLYYLDRALFPYARPDKFLRQIEEGMDKIAVERLHMLFATSMIRRAIIIGFGLVAIALGT